RRESGTFASRAATDAASRILSTLRSCRRPSRGSILGALCLQDDCPAGPDPSRAVSVHHHITLAILVEYLERRLSAADELQLESHLRSGGDRCGGDADWIATWRQDAASDLERDAPEGVIRRALDSIRRWMAADPPLS